MSDTGMLFLVIGVILVFIFIVNNYLDTRKFVNETAPYFKILMEDDYKFYVMMKYGEKANVYDLFEKRVREMDEKNTKCKLVILLPHSIPSARITSY